MIEPQDTERPKPCWKRERPTPLSPGWAGGSVGEHQVHFTWGYSAAFTALRYHPAPTPFEAMMLPIDKAEALQVWPSLQVDPEGRCWFTSLEVEGSRVPFHHGIASEGEAWAFLAARAREHLERRAELAERQARRGPNHTPHPERSTP